ncbi:hypothetical protein LWM68_21480 [Niabella sp. W65]|nr:hypothetical protein [Niabella sp. W65]MCH7365102.1 hypothetical protein [Niabella sp. W65]
MNRKGDIREEVIRSREDNYDILASSNFNLSDKIKISANLGASHQSRYLRMTGNSGNQFIVPNLFVINNTLLPTPIYST